jgi:hypothetical protein
MAPTERPSRSRLLLAAAGALLLAAAAVAVLSTRPDAANDDTGHAAKGQTANGIWTGRLTPIARQLATTNGEPHPTGAMAVRTTDGTASALGGSGTGRRGASAPVDLVVMRGRFVGYGAKRPAGSPPPRGSVMTVTVDERTGTIAAYSIGQTAPDLASLGDPVELDLGI